MKKIETVDFLENKILSDLKISEKFKVGLFTVKALNLEPNTYDKTVYRLNTITEEMIPLALDFSIDSYDVFEEGFLLTSYLDEITSLYKYDGNTVKKITSIPLRIFDTTVFKKHIYFSKPCDESIDMDGILMSSDLPFHRAGSNRVGKRMTHLYRSDLNGENISQLTSDDLDVRLVCINERYGHILFTASPECEKNNAISYLYEIDQEGQVKQITKAPYRIDGLELVGDSRAAFEAVDLRLDNRNDNQQVYWVSLETLCVTKDMEVIDYSNEVPSIHSDLVLSKGIKTLGDAGKLYSIRTGRYKQFVSIHGMNESFQIMDLPLIALYCIQKIGDTLWVIGAKKMGVTEIYTFNEALRTVSNFNGWLNGKEISVPDRVLIHHEGVDIDGYVYKPMIDTKGKAPGILMIHGGPKLMYAEVYNHDIQLLASKGYYVFCSNPMGSDGRGNEFLDIRGKYASLPYEQLMAFTNYVCETYPVDSDKLGVSGGSYGGYMTNYILTKTDRFQAAVSERGISNHLTAMMSSDIGVEYTMEYMGGDKCPWDNYDMYRDQSPLHFANQVKTPVLFNHGKEDHRCLYTESLNFYSALKYFGIDTKICIYEGEYHSLVIAGRPKSKIKRYDELVSWFDKYL